jgi:ribosomal protein S15P/S13E
MKELEENTIEQIRTLLNYLQQTDLLKHKDILMCLDVIARDYGGKVVDEN